MTVAFAQNPQCSKGPIAGALLIFVLNACLFLVALSILTTRVITDIIRFSPRTCLEASKYTLLAILAQIQDNNYISYVLCRTAMHPSGNPRDDFSHFGSCFKSDRRLAILNIYYPYSSSHVLLLSVQFPLRVLLQYALAT